MKIHIFYRIAFLFSLLVVNAAGCIKAKKEDPAITRSREIVSLHKAIFELPPEHVPSFKIVDGPITGNGDIGLTLSGAPEKQTYWISKNDFWKSGPDFKQAGPSLIGGIDVCIDELKDASYHVEQILYEPVISSGFSTGDNVVNMDARVMATDNLIVLEVMVNKKPVHVQLDLWVKDGYGSKTESGTEGGVFWVARKFDTDDLLYPSEAAIALHCLDSDINSFILEPGKPITIIASVKTNHESATYQKDAIEKAAKIDHNLLKGLVENHNEWWQDFWAKSLVEIEDKLLEKYYYSSHYVMACCSRNENFPPGLYGNWITMDRTAWSGDIHLNYNHQAPFWALYSSNRVEITDPYDTPLLEGLDLFKEFSKKFLNKRGAYAPVGIGPKGLTMNFVTREEMDEAFKPLGSTSYESLANQPQFLGQKSNAIFASMNMILRYHYTYDEEYIKKVYPYLLAVAEFWEDYLVFEDGRYVIYDDSFGEVGPWQGKGWEEGYGDFNPTNTLGFLRAFFNGMIEISGDLGNGEGRLEKWKHILNNLSDFPVFVENEKRQFRAVEGGDGSSKDRIGLDWGMVHGLIFPATNFGLGSDPEYLKMIHEGIDTWNDRTWLNHGNSIQSVLIGAARVGYDPEILIDKAKQKIEKYAYPNLWIFTDGGGIETCSAIPGMLNEMMLQSHEDVIRIFPVFPSDQKASFYRLRTFGAFLVSSEIENGKVTYAFIESEKGRDCKIVNPWPGEQVKVLRNGKDTEHLAGKELWLKTKVGEQLLLAPEGTDMKTIKQVW